MQYVVLLRGINVGGNNKVSMAELRQCLEDAGYKNVSTYINSGNVILESNESSVQEITDTIHMAIEKTFGFLVHVVVLDKDSFLNIANELPKSWVNDKVMKCDVMFLWAEIDNPAVLEKFVIKPEFDTVKYVPGSVLWAVDRQDINKSGLLKLVGTPTYKKMTIRNCNTVRKLATLLQ